MACRKNSKCYPKLLYIIIAQSTLNISALSSSFINFISSYPDCGTCYRFILDNPALVRGKTVLDFGCGCGASGLAAKTVDARRVTFNDIDEGEGMGYVNRKE